MYYDVRKMPDLPVVLGTWYEGFKFSEHGTQFGQAANVILDEQTEPVFYVIDISQMQTISIDGVTQVAHSGARVLTSSHRHPMNRETVLVSKATIVKLAVKGVASAAFGNMKIKLFETLDEALDYVKGNS